MTRGWAHAPARATTSIGTIFGVEPGCRVSPEPPLAAFPAPFAGSGGEFTETPAHPRQIALNFGDMNRENIRSNESGTTLTGLIVLTATVVTAAVVWNTFTSQVTVSTVLSGDEARTIVSMLFDVLYDALAHLLRYMSKASLLVA